MSTLAPPLWARATISLCWASATAEMESIRAWFCGCRAFHSSTSAWRWLPWPSSRPLRITRSPGSRRSEESKSGTTNAETSRVTTAPRAMPEPNTNRLRCRRTKPRNRSIMAGVPSPQPPEQVHEDLVERVQPGVVTAAAGVPGDVPQRERAARRLADGDHEDPYPLVPHLNVHIGRSYAGRVVAVGEHHEAAHGVGHPHGTRYLIDPGDDR